MTASATADVSFDYEILPIRDLQVTTEVNKKNGRQEVTSVTVAGQNLAPTDRFWLASSLVTVSTRAFSISTTTQRSFLGFLIA